MTQQHSLRSDTSSERFYLLIDQGFVMDGHRDRCCSVVGFKKKIKSAPRTYIDRQIDGCKQVRERRRLRKEMRGGPNAATPTTGPPSPPLAFHSLSIPSTIQPRHRYTVTTNSTIQYNTLPKRQPFHPSIKNIQVLIKLLIDEIQLAEISRIYGS